ncbi:DUF4157 domain-containing protein [Nostoc sp. NMS8]|uniref:eCIS core domain-containing protein n=1 Tax=Nostoc sp. NMS8 TaxID=2815392 RepID=UPI0025D084FC|nr:DUF4157 domain-containing protein [Nostoc sp. NMS8]MBN3960849.1 DUF4157 domain-containing protein [Nostoc sp. NMS8]
MREQVSRQKKTTTGFSIPSLKHPTPSFGLESSAISRQAVPKIQPLHKPLTHDISRIPLRTQAKLSISQPGDIYEQEADSVAQQVMQRMAQPGNRQPIQREALPEEEELQMMPMMQCQAEAGMAATPDLEASINQARGGGQAIADNIREPMEVAFGADFSGVKVHTDGKSDQLNRSIQARAFTTGHDVFFGQGEYNPGSRDSQELLAHELTHVVQQNGGAVKRSLLEKTQEDSFLEASAEPIQQPIQKKESLTGAITSLTTALSGGHVVQLKVKIKGKPTKTYANFGAFKKSPLYKPLINSLTKYSPEVVEFHLKQLFSTDAEFENEQHFTEALTYDIEHKSMPDQEYTLQEQYMTLYGWKKRETGTQSATDAEPAEGEPETLKVYRTMKLEDWKELEGGNHAKLSGHLGDFKQAQNYLYRKSPEPKVLVEFTLRPGAERELFSSGIMAFPDVKGKTVPNLIKSTLIKEGGSDSFAKASTNEGTAPDKVGVKSEGGEAGFSLGIGGGTSPEVFMGLVANMSVIGRSEAEG